MSGFDFTGNYPTWAHSIYCAIEHGKPCTCREPEPDPVRRLEGFDAKVDYLMNVRGYDRDEAERVALEILMDDAA